MMRAENENYVLTVNYDEFAESPREWGMGTVVQWHRRYNFGDENINMDMYDSAQEVLLHECGSPNDIIYLPVYIYDHGGITLNTTGFSCPWDSGQVGWIYVTKEQVRKEYGVKRISKQLKQRILGYLEGEIKELDHYVTGNVYSYTLESKDGQVIDSCHGFFGNNFKTNGMLDQLGQEHTELLEEVGY